MKRSRIQKVRNIFIVLILMFVMFTFYSCLAYRHQLSFNINKQILSSCDSGSIKRLRIENDSIKPNGFPYEGGVRMQWKGELDKAPSEINIMNIPKEYHIIEGGVSTPQI